MSACFSSLLDETQNHITLAVRGMLKTQTYAHSISIQVQQSVANCLPPLVPAIKSDAPELVKKLLQLLLESENFGERKGAAYGLAGLVRGLGITALKQLEIMTTLEDAVKDKKNPRRREGKTEQVRNFC